MRARRTLSAAQRALRCVRAPRLFFFLRRRFRFSAGCARARALPALPARAPGAVCRHRSGGRGIAQRGMAPPVTRPRASNQTVDSPVDCVDGAPALRSTPCVGFAGGCRHPRHLATRLRPAVTRARPAARPRPPTSTPLHHAPSRWYHAPAFEQTVVGHILNTMVPRTAAQRQISRRYGAIRRRPSPSWRPRRRSLASSKSTPPRRPPHSRVNAASLR